MAVDTPQDYIAAIKDEDRRQDISALHALITTNAPACTPHVRSGMLGYGSYTYKYASGRMGEWSQLALASNKQYISLYAGAIEDGAYLTDRFRSRLPKASIGKSCVRFKRLSDVDTAALAELINQTAAYYAARHNHVEP